MARILSIAAIGMTAAFAAVSGTVNVLELSQGLPSEAIEWRARFLRRLNASTLSFEGGAVPDAWREVCDRYGFSAVTGTVKGEPNLEEPCLSIPIPEKYLRVDGPTNAWRYLSNEDGKRGNALLLPDGRASRLADDCFVKWSAIKVLQDEAGQECFTIYNNSGNIHLKTCHAFCIYAEDGLERRRVNLGRLEVAPGGSISVELPKEKRGLPFGKRKFGVKSWTFFFSLGKSTPWAEKGFVFAADQVVAFDGGQETEPIRSGKPLEIVDKGERFAVEGDGFCIGIGKRSGLIESWRVDGRERLLAPIALDFGSLKGDSPLKEAWRNAFGSFVVRPGESKFDEYGLCHIGVPIRLFLPNPVDCKLEYEISPEGELKIGFAFERLSRSLRPPRAGLRFKLDPAIDSVAWVGRGPWEGEVAPFGRYEAPMAKMYSAPVELVEPMPRCGVRGVEFKRGGEVVLEAFSTRPFSLLVLPAPLEDLRRRKFPVALWNGGAWEVLFDSEVRDDYSLQLRLKLTKSAKAWDNTAVK